MVRYFVVNKDYTVGSINYKKGSLFELVEGEPEGTIYSGSGESPITIYRGKCLNTGRVFIILETDLEFLRHDFVPCSFYNHAVELGFTGNPEFLSKQYNLALQTRYLRIGEWSSTITVDECLELYVTCGDQAKESGDKVVAGFSDQWLRRHDFLVRLKQVVGEYNKQTEEVYPVTL